MGEALERFAPLSLHRKDKISFYALHCGSMRFVMNVPIDSASLGKGVKSVLEPWMPRKGNQHEARCKPGMLLWDGVAKVVTSLSDGPGAASAFGDYRQYGNKPVERGEVQRRKLGLRSSG